MVVALETPIGQYAPDFELPGVDGSVHHLTQYLTHHRAIAVVVMGNCCPYVKKSLGYLKRLQTQLTEQGCTVVGINGNDSLPGDAPNQGDESLEGMEQFAKTHQLNFPYLRDITQDVLRTFKAQTTPEVYLLNQDGVVCYAGAIAPPESADSEEPLPQAYLEEAIAQLLAEKPITVPCTQAVGTPIQWRA